MILEGFQAIVNDEVCVAGDWIIGPYGEFYADVDHIGYTAKDLGDIYGERVYRKIPVAKQGDLDGQQSAKTSAENAPEQAQDFSSKPINPKDKIGSNKLPLDLVPATGIAYEALAFAEGGFKYGTYNFRAIGVRSSIYLAACKRHLLKWENGQDLDPKTLVHHLGSARACLNVILDAMVAGKLDDDRPPKNEGLVALIDAMQDDVVRLKEMYKDRHPKNYTIADEVL